MAVHAPDDALVVRFGKRGRFLEILLRDAQFALEAEGRADVSVWCAPAAADETVEVAEQRICREILPFYPGGKWFRGSRVEWIRMDGFIPRRDEGTDQPHPFHYDVDMGDVATTTGERFFRRFGNELRNDAWPIKQ